MSHTDTGQAVVGAAAEAVFAALVDAAARAAWLPPTGMSGELSWFDARPGGGYRMRLTYDDELTPGKTEQHADVVDVRFIEVDPPRRLVEEADFVSDDPSLTGTMTMTWSLEPVEHGTLVSITATDVPDGISSEDHVEAFAATLRNLDDYVTHNPSSKT